MERLEFINKDFILARLSPEQIFCYYFGILEVDLNIFYLNPLRDDNNPDCKFYINRHSNILYFNDFAWKHFDCFGYVQEQYGLKFNEAVYKIIIDFELVDDFSVSGILGTERTKYLKSVKPVEKKSFTVTTRKHNYRNLKYWKNFLDYITEEDLKKYNIFPLHTLYMNKKPLYTTTYKNSFVYLLGGKHFQCYGGEGNLLRGNKFFNTVNKVVGLKILDNTKEYVVITKSYKDWFLMKLMGINAITIMSETQRLSENDLSFLDGFKHVFTLFDNDVAGKKATIRFKRNYKTKPLLFSKGMEKDYSDNLLKFGSRDLWEMVQEVQEYYNIEEI
jgi:hypothetical protein